MGHNFDASLLLSAAQRWHRQGIRLCWRWKSRHPGRPDTEREIRELIRKMCVSNPTWGAPRIHGDAFRAQAANLQISEVLAAPRSPWQTPYVESLIGSIRRECLDHIIVINESSLRRTLKSFFEYYHSSRMHLALAKDAPESRPIQPPRHRWERTRQTRASAAFPGRSRKRASVPRSAKLPRTPPGNPPSPCSPCNAVARFFLDFPSLRR